MRRLAGTLKFDSKLSLKLFFKALGALGLPVLILGGIYGAFLRQQSLRRQEFFCITTLAKEEIMLVISFGLLKRNFGKDEVRKMEHGIDLNRFSYIPFNISFKTRRANHAIQEYLNYYHVKLYVIYNISDSDTQIMLYVRSLRCALSEAASGHSTPA